MTVKAKYLAAAFGVNVGFVRCVNFALAFLVPLGLESQP
jgi:hypothetical protein